MSEKPFATGSCLCGKVSLKAAVKPLLMGQCHCTDCQKSSGTGHMSLAFFPKETVSIEGETSAYTAVADNGAEVTRHFCPDCGSRLFGTNTVLKTVMGVAVGCLDEHEWFKADRIVYHKRKPVWDFMDETIPVYDEMPPMPPK